MWVVLENRGKMYTTAPLVHCTSMRVRDLVDLLQFRILAAVSDVLQSTKNKLLSWVIVFGIVQYLELLTQMLGIVELSRADYWLLS